MYDVYISVPATEISFCAREGLVHFKVPLYAMFQLPFLYDGVHHRASTGHETVFFVEGAAAPLLGLAAVPLSTAFVNVETQEPWQGYEKYLSCDGSKTTAVEAFAYSSFFDEGKLLIALKMKSLKASQEPETLEIVILLADFKKSSSTFSIAPCLNLFDGRSSVQYGSCDYHTVASRLLPHQKLNVNLAVKDSKHGFSVESVELVWADCQHKSLENFVVTRPRLGWAEKVTAALTGRKDAFPGLGPCHVQRAMLVQQRRPYQALQLSFVVFFRYNQAMGKLWSCRARHLYKPSETDSLVSNLEVDDQVGGVLYAEWRQVGSGMHHVLEATTRLQTREPLLASQLGASADSVPRDIGNYKADYWTELWKHEDTKQDLTTRCYWQAYRCDCLEIQVIDDDDDEGCSALDVGKMVETTFRQLEGFVANKVKSEVLKERLNEKRVPVETMEAIKKKRKIQQADCGFVDPYADICKAQRNQLEVEQVPVFQVPVPCDKEPLEVDVTTSGDVLRKEHENTAYEASRKSSSGDKDQNQKWESWDWKNHNSWEGRRRWRRNSEWKEDWHDSHSKKRRTLSPPPPPKRLDHAEHVPPLQPFFGAGSLHEGLRPLKFFRRVLETEGISFIGREDDFKVRETIEL
jgi:hypothetical protein